MQHWRMVDLWWVYPTLYIRGCIHPPGGSGFLPSTVCRLGNQAGEAWWSVNISMYTRWTHHLCTCSGNSHETLSHQICMIMPFRVQNMTVFVSLRDDMPCGKLPGFAVASGLCLGAQCFTFFCGHGALPGSFFLLLFPIRALFFFFWYIWRFKKLEIAKSSTQWLLKVFFLGSHGCNRPPKRLNMVDEFGFRSPTWYV